jgi:murein DD-endopeptidase MepM/ murein hydrolase activator NlpD
MKISLYFKPSYTKVCSFLVTISLFAGTPLWADASFFSDWVLGAPATANEVIPENGVIHNSQTIPLLESSINPDLKNSSDINDMVIVQEDSFIYSDGSFGPDVVFEKSPISDLINVYTVKEGDTLSGIAETFDVSVNTIRWENNISGQTISVGQKLNILPVTGVKHIVKKGDTVAKIASKYDSDTEDILVYNGINKEDGLKQGDIIFVPNGIIKPIVVAKSGSSLSAKVVSSNTQAPAGYYSRPVPGPVTSKYGSRRGGFHYGVDLGGANGITPIVAAADGVVSKVVSVCVAGYKNCGGRYGNYVIIEHSNGTSTMYAHLYSVSVKLGQNVSRGGKIGVLGNTGRSTGPHLHFEVINANGSKMRPSI